MVHLAGFDFLNFLPFFLTPPAKDITIHNLGNEGEKIPRPRTA